MNVEFWIALAILLSGVMWYVVKSKSMETRRRNIARYGFSWDTSLGRTIKFLVLLAVMLIITILIFSHMSREGLGYKLFLVAFEGFTVALFVSLAFVEENEGFAGLIENLFGYSMAVPLGAVLFDFIFALLGVIDIENEYVFRFVFTLVGIGLVTGILILMAAVEIPQFQNGEEIEGKIQNFLLRQKAKSFYLLLGAIALTLAFTV